jgi:hypothetical protein
MTTPYPEALFVVCRAPKFCQGRKGICEARNLLLSAAEEIEQLEQQQGRMPEVCEKLVAAEQKVEQLEKQLRIFSQRHTNRT